MIPGFHGVDLIVILAIALLIFGPKKLPEMGSAIGKSIKEFRKGMNELNAPKPEEETKAQPPTSYEAIEREIAARKATAAAAAATTTSEPIYETPVADATKVD